MKNYILLAVIVSLFLIGCEKENIEPEIINNYDTVYVAQEPSEIGDFEYTSSFTTVFDTERELTGIGNNTVILTDHSLRFNAVSFNAETNTHVGGSGDYDSIKIDYVDFDRGIIIGTIFGSHNSNNELMVTNGTFRYEHNESFDVNTVTSTGIESKYFLYN